MSLLALIPTPEPPALPTIPDEYTHQRRARLDALQLRFCREQLAALPWYARLCHRALALLTS